MALIVCAMSADPNPRPSGPHVFQFPPPNGSEQPHLPDFSLPPDVIVDPYNELFCIVCQTSVPRSESNALEHVSGRRHIMNDRRLFNEEPIRKETIREYFVNLAETQRAISRRYSHSPANLNAHNAAVRNRLPDASSLGDSVAKPFTNATTPTNISHMTTSNTPLTMNGTEASAIASAELIPNPERELRKSKLKSGIGTLAKGSTGASCESQNSSGAASDLDKKKLLREERIKFAEQVLTNSKFDTNDYVQGILADGDDSSSEKRNGSGDLSDTDSGFGHYTSRRQSSSMFEYKAPDGPDNSLDFMVPETSRKDFTGQILGLHLKSKRGSAESFTTGAGLHEGGSNSTAQFIPMRSTEDEETKCDRFGQRRKRWISQNGLLILHDDNGEELPPWLLSPIETDNVLCSADSSVALHFEILQFEKFVSPTKAEIQARNEVIMTVESITKKLWPHSSLHIFGSVATNLALPSSDVDISIMGSPECGSESEFHTLANAVRSISGFAKRVQVIRAKVPLVKIISRSSGMNCDVSIGTGNGVDNVPRIKGFLEQYPALRPLLLVVKCFLRQRGLNDVFTGGLGSYALLLMVVSHLQMAAHNFPKVKANLGTQIQHFFQFYGEMWNPCLTGIQIRDGGMYYDKFERFGSAPFETLRFSIEDPNDVNNEIARNSFGVLKIRTAFQNASRSLLRWMRDDASTSPTPLGAIIFTEFDFLKRRRVVIEDLQRQGKSVLCETVGEGRACNIDKLRGVGSFKSVPKGVCNTSGVNRNEHIDDTQNSQGLGRGIPFQEGDPIFVVNETNKNRGEVALLEASELDGPDPVREIGFANNQRRSMMTNGESQIISGTLGAGISRADAAAVANISMVRDGAERMEEGGVFSTTAGNGVVDEPMMVSNAVIAPNIQPPVAASSIHVFNSERDFGGPAFIPANIEMPVDFPKIPCTPHPGVRRVSRSNSGDQFRGRNSFRKSLRRGKRGGVRKLRR